MTSHQRASGSQKIAIAPRWPAGPDDREGAHLEVARLADGGADPHRACARRGPCERDHQRQRLRRRSARRQPDRLEAPRPTPPAHRPRLLEAQPEQLAGGVVEVDEVALRVDQERRGREVRRQAARQDDLDRMLRGAHRAILIRSAPRERAFRQLGRFRAAAARMPRDELEIPEEQAPGRRRRVPRRIAPQCRRRGDRRGDRRHRRRSPSSHRRAATTRRPRRAARAAQRSSTPSRRPRPCSRGSRRRATRSASRMRR